MAVTTAALSRDPCAPFSLEPVTPAVPLDCGFRTGAPCSVVQARR